MTWQQLMDRISMMTPADRQKTVHFIDLTSDGGTDAWAVQIGRYREQTTVPDRAGRPITFEKGDIYLE